MKYLEDGSYEGSAEELAKFFKLKNEDKAQSDKRYRQFNPYLIWIPAGIGIFSLILLNHVGGELHTVFQSAAWIAWAICLVLCQLRFDKLKVTLTVGVTGLIILLLFNNTLSSEEIKQTGKDIIESQFPTKQDSTN